MAAISWATWKARNKIFFEKKKVHNPIEILCHACALMRYWTNLCKEMDREALIEGVDTMVRVAKEVLAAHHNTIFRTKTGKNVGSGNNRTHLT